MRRANRQVFDLAEIREILEAGKILWLGIPDGDYPYVLPLNYGYTLDGGGALKLIFHGARAGRKFDLLNRNPKVGFSLGVCDEIAGDGENACEYTARYASIVGTGEARLLQDSEAVQNTLASLMRVAAGAGNFTFSEKALENTAVYEIAVRAYEAKSNRKV